MSRAGYRIDDEPSPGPLERWVVNPVWPLFGLMFAGAYVGYTWFVFNGVAMGSARRWREWAVVALAIVLKVVFLAVLTGLLIAGVIDKSLTAYTPIGLVLIKLAAGYTLFNLQQSSFALFQHFRGIARNGFFVVVLAAFLSNRLLDNVPTWVRILLL